ncbi:hypothetical protein E9232_002614 [Inquilinus ginsengisoli]|uniref:XRE family transcriptional regulator n=1 Tax=Inquilinus ginsengisoli TaxID=363840 RepID=A0ABU1JP51_9PROT|nr:hypothetical protein [Inquilinus ginsengisoli]MDR6290093.1 hypothetical protein [Inquilinus ginsengisoli]
MYRTDNSFRIALRDYETYRQPMDTPITDFDALFDRWERPARLAADLGISPQHLRMIRVRRSIPVRFWPRLIASAKRRGIAGLSYDLLVRLHVPDEFAGPPSINLSSQGDSMTHHPTIDQIESMPTAEIAALPAEALAALVEDLIVLAERCRAIRGAVFAALALRHGDPAEMPLAADAAPGLAVVRPHPKAA